MSKCMLFNITDYPCTGGATTISCMSPGETNKIIISNYRII